MISPDLHEFIESGISILVGTRGDRLLPECCRAVGAKVENEGRELTVYLPQATAGTTLSNLRNNGRIAVCFSRSGDHRSIQIKGRLLAITDGGEEARRVILKYRSALAESWGVIGVPPRITLRMAHWPCHEARFQVTSLFNQSPGPGAGSTLGPRDGSAKP